MSRMNRFQAARVTPPKVSKHERARAFLRKIRRDVLDRMFPDRKTMPPLYEWQVIFPVGPLYVFEANTKSDVRAAIKRQCGIVPAGVIITKTGRSPRAEWIAAHQKAFHDKHQPDRPGETEGSPVLSGDSDRTA